MVFTEEQIREQEKLLHPSVLQIPKSFLRMMGELRMQKEVVTVEDVLEKKELVDKRISRWLKSNTGKHFPFFFLIYFAKILKKNFLILYFSSEARKIFQARRRDRQFEKMSRLSPACGSFWPRPKLLANRMEQMCHSSPSSLKCQL